MKKLRALISSPTTACTRRRTRSWLMSARGQLGDLEQRRLQALGALALDDLQLQALVGVGQLQRALAHRCFQFVLALLALQRGEDVAGDERQQRLVVRGVADARLDSSAPPARRAPGRRAASARRASRSCRGRTTLQRPGHLLPAARSVSPISGLPSRITYQVSVPSRVPAGSRARVARRGVLDVGEVQEADRVALGVVQHDEEVLRVHQRADDRVDAAQHVRHVALGAGQVGDREQRALQLLRMRQARVGLLQFGPAQRAREQAAPTCSGSAIASSSRASSPRRCRSARRRRRQRQCQARAIVRAQRRVVAAHAQAASGVGRIRRRAVRPVRRGGAGSRRRAASGRLQRDAATSAVATSCAVAAASSGSTRAIGSASRRGGMGVVGHRHAGPRPARMV